MTHHRSKQLKKCAQTYYTYVRIVAVQHKRHTVQSKRYYSTRYRYSGEKSEKDFPTVPYGNIFPRFYEAIRRRTCTVNIYFIAFQNYVYRMGNSMSERLLKMTYANIYML